MVYKLKEVFYALDDLRGELSGADGNLELARDHIKQAMDFVMLAAEREFHAEAQTRFKSDWERPPVQEKGPQS